MISAKIASIIAIAAFAAGAFSASPAPQAIAAVIATDVQCTGCVGKSDLAGSAVTSAKIKDGEVKTADIGFEAVAAGRIANGAVGTLKIADDSITAADIKADAVGASELAGVSNLVFAECTATNNFGTLPGASNTVVCAVSGADAGDDVMVTRKLGTGNSCFAVTVAGINVADNVAVSMRNVCATAQTFGTGSFSIIVFDK